MGHPTLPMLTRMHQAAKLSLLAFAGALAGLCATVVSTWMGSAELFSLALYLGSGVMALVGATMSVIGLMRKQWMAMVGFLGNLAFLAFMVWSFATRAVSS